MSDRVVRALYDYAAGTEAELSCKAGDEFFLLEKMDGGWFCCESMDGKVGHLPESYMVVLLEEEELEDEVAVAAVVAEAQKKAEALTSSGKVAVPADGAPNGNGPSGEEGEIEEEAGSFSTMREVGGASEGGETPSFLLHPSVTASNAGDGESDDDTAEESFDVTSTPAPAPAQHAPTPSPAEEVSRAEPEATASTSEATASTSEATTSSAPATAVDLSPEQRAKMMAARKRIAQEVLDTETTYVNGLRLLIDLYLRPITARLESKKKPILTKDVVTAVFSNLELLINVNEQLYDLLQKRVPQWTDETQLGDIFIQMAPFLKSYTQYCNTFENCNSVVERQLKTNSSFKKFCKKAKADQRSVGLDLMSYLIMPVQRVPRYVLLLNDLRKKTPEDHPDHKLLGDALAAVQEVGSSINTGVAVYQAKAKLIAIEQDLCISIGLVQPHRQHVMEGELTAVYRDKHIETGAPGGESPKKLKKAATTMDALKRGGYASVYVYLLNDTIVFAEIRDRKRFLDRVTLQLCFLDENPDPADQRCFSLECPIASVAQQYNLIAETEEQKQQWCAKISEVTSQLLKSKPVYRVQRKKFEQRMQETAGLSKKELKKRQKEEKKEQKKIKKEKDRFNF